MGVILTRMPAAAAAASEWEELRCQLPPPCMRGHLQASCSPHEARGTMFCPSPRHVHLAKEEYRTHGFSRSNFIGSDFIYINREKKWQRFEERDELALSTRPCTCVFNTYDISVGFIPLHLCFISKYVFT